MRFVSKRLYAPRSVKAKLFHVGRYYYIYVFDLSPNQSTNDVMAVLRELDGNYYFEVDEQQDNDFCHCNNSTTEVRT